MIRRMKDDMARGMDTWVRYSVTGPRGAVQLVFMRNPFDLLEQAGVETPRREDSLWDKEGYGGWVGADLGYHSPVPMFDGHDMSENGCDLLGECPCFYDGSSLNAMRPELAKAHVEGNEDALYAYLESYYRATFGDPEHLLSNEPL